MLARGNRGWRGAARATLVGGVAALLLALAPGAGWASDELTSADPATGAALTDAPVAVVLTFTATPDPDLSHVSVRTQVGAEVGQGEAVAVGTRGLRLALSIRSSGDYTVAYHAVFTSGTEAVGALRFSVGTEQAPPPLSADAAQAAQQAAAMAGHDHSVDPLSGTLLVIDVVVLLSVLTLLWLRPRASDHDELTGRT
jgi:methionine-rich copper-binding protein CopC